MSRTVQVTIDAASPRRLGLFWREVLGYAVDAPPGREAADAGPEATADAWLVFLERVGVPREQWDSAFGIHDPEGEGPRLFLQQVGEKKAGKNRVHLDVRAAPGLEGEERMAALEAECARLVELGATRLSRHEPAPPMSAGHLVLADPEGNEFCLD